MVVMVADAVVYDSGGILQGIVDGTYCMTDLISIDVTVELLAEWDPVMYR